MPVTCFMSSCTAPRPLAVVRRRRLNSPKRSRTLSGTGASPSSAKRSEVCIWMDTTQGCWRASMAVMRLVGSTTSSPRIKSFAPSEIFAQYLSGKAGASPAHILAWSLASSAAAKGGQAESRMYTMTPTAHMSHSRPYRRSPAAAPVAEMTSGAAYPGVPQRVRRATSRQVSPSGAEAMILPRPKSVMQSSASSVSEVRRMFSGLRSLWQMCLSWR
mmetsp:Transcript_5610/g.19047  ORF Transcript_5610/g.19047 Transcript_5610/m.19047 type:complete len:216 (-) Transcript_5610:94-741(-)